MINIDVCAMRQRTYRRLLGKLTEDQIEKLANLQKYVVKSITEAVYNGRWSVDLRCEEFDIAEIILIELRMKGFITHLNLCYRNSISKADPYYELQIDWQLGD